MSSEIISSSHLLLTNGALSQNFWVFLADVSSNPVCRVHFKAEGAGLFWWWGLLVDFLGCKYLDFQWLLVFRVLRPSIICGAIKCEHNDEATKGA